MLTSSVLMTDDVIVHVGQLVIVLISVNWCFRLLNPDGFLHLSDSSVWFFIHNFPFLLVCDVIFSCCIVCKGGFIDVRQ